MKALAIITFLAWLLVISLVLAGCASTVPNDNPPPKFEYEDD
jgi:hypothetical protein